MNIEIILMVFGLSQIFANNMSNKEFYYAPEYSDLLFKKMLSQLNTILMENQQINTNLGCLNKRFNEQEISEKNMNVSKDMDMLIQKDGSWTVIQRREDDSINFNRSWLEYEEGFGFPNGNFFIGLEKLHALTTNGDQELWINLRDLDGNSRWAVFEKFVVGSAAERYSLKELGSYSGTAGNSLHYHVTFPFSTSETSVCGQRFGAGWWYNTNRGDDVGCFESHLNGPYLKKKNQTGGIVWNVFRGRDNSLKYVEMLIRSVP